MIARYLLLFCLILVPACGGEEPNNALVVRGQDLARQYGCVSCHTADGSKSVGPTWRGLYGSKVELQDGTTVLADDEYLRESILQPSSKTVKGFPEGRMESVIRSSSVPEEDLLALIAYIKSLR